MKSIHRRHGLGPAALILGAVLALGIMGCPPAERTDEGETEAEGMAAETGTEQSAESQPGTTTLTIRTDASGACMLVGPAGSATVEVPRGDWVAWKNETDADVALSFGRVKRLTGVYEAVVFAGDELKLRIRGDADPSTHEYTYRCGQVTLPGAKIIVPPPPGGE